MNAEPSPSRPRLRAAQQAEREAAVLADLVENGPSTFRDVERRLLAIIDADRRSRTAASRVNHRCGAGGG